MTTGDSKKVPAWGAFHQADLETQKAKGVRTVSVILLSENLRAQNVGRELVFSAVFWYNGTNEKPLPLGEVAAKPTERAKWSENH